MKAKILLLTTALLAGAGALAQAKASGTTDEAADKAIIAAQLPSYPLDSCVISGEPLTEMGGPIDLVVDGRLLRVCCKGCTKGVKKDPAAAIAKVDAAVIAAQGPSYPLETCVVSGEALGSMGDPLDVVHGTRLLRVCCKGCIKGVKKDPAAALAKVDEALIAQQLKSYPLDSCPISGESLGSMGDAINHLHGTRLVRLCCKMCLKEFQKDPAKVLAKLDEAAGEKRG